ncbi:hypothetical protein BC940DRAFT_320720 [Gongronella butleri]|nr:hypothetical protein BC940DRAFT_320720 [Gongronella butleri]
MSGGNIKVFVRCRPLNSRELARGATGLIEMRGNQTIISKPADLCIGKESEDQKAFTFDKSYWSADKSSPDYADQQTVYNDVGEELLNHAFDGYNCCIFAYGQTGSGKSYSMMGYGEDIGIIPRTCAELFNRITQNTDPNVSYAAEVSYIEIYNEKVRDLLNPKNKGNLKVREHPSTGPYVEDLSRLVVKDFDGLDHLMDEGNKARTVAATNMNETSSRSHAVFTVFLTQKRKDELTKLETEKVARISLVDLAGSERANSTGATGARLKEGANINRSLTTLGKVIAGLAEQSERKPGKKSKDNFIPYRDSVLTWLLKDSLGGNSKTAMIAAISPADYDETLSTLRYADQAKKIKNKAVVNEDPNAKMIRELKEELSLLRDRLHVYAPDIVQELAASSVLKMEGGSGGNGKPLGVAGSGGGGGAIPNQDQVIDFVDATGTKKTMTKLEMIDQLQSSEKLLANLNETWEEKLKRTEHIQVERARALEELGITVHKNNVSLRAPKNMPHLVNLNEDPLMSECLVYQLKPGVTHVSGRDRQPAPEMDQQSLEVQKMQQHASITLGGSNIQLGHCWFDNKDDIVTLHPKGDTLVMVNGVRLAEPRELHSGDRIILGDYHIFRFNHPEQVRRARELQHQQQQLQQSPLEEDPSPQQAPSQQNTPKARPPRLQLPTKDDVGAILGSPEPMAAMDWNYARLEAVRNYYCKENDYKSINDDELEKLFDEITRARNSRRNTRCMSMISFDDASYTTYSTTTTLDQQHPPHSAAGAGAAAGAAAALPPRPPPLPSSVLPSPAVAAATMDLSSQYEEKMMMEKERLKKELDDQKQFYEAKINRMSAYLNDPNRPDDPLLVHNLLLESTDDHLLDLSSSPATPSPSPSPGPLIDPILQDLSHTQKRQLHGIFQQWQGMRHVAMAEVVLTHAALLKEANVLAHEMGKQTTYQFTIIEPGPFVKPRSTLEPVVTNGYTTTATTTTTTTNTPLALNDTHYCQNDENQDDDDQDLRLAMAGVRPCIGVRVLDRHHQVMYTWSLGKFNLRLDRMRQLLAYRDQPVFQTIKKKWDDADPFYDHPAPKYSFIGYAATSARNLVWQQPFESAVQVICRATGQVKGQLRVFLSPVADRVPVSSPASPSLQDERTGGRLINKKTKKDTIKVGQTLVFEVRLLDVCGLSAADWSHVHVQFRLSSFGLPLGGDNASGGGGGAVVDAADRWFVTESVPLLSASPSSLVPLDYSQTFSLTVTAEMLDRLQHNMVYFELYGLAQPRLLDQYERWDDQREKPRLEDMLAVPRVSHSMPNDRKMRKKDDSAAQEGNKQDNDVENEHHEQDKKSMEPMSLLGGGVVEQHEVTAWIQVYELLPNGEYQMVHAVKEHAHDTGVFHLRQGLQRRIAITLAHQSGRQFEWSQISKATVGKIRLLDDQGRIVDAQQLSDELPIKLLSAQHSVTYHKDGTSHLTAQGAWDSSQHECHFLNRLTASRARILLRLTWQVESPKCSKTIQFGMDVAMRVIHRDRVSGPTTAHRLKRLLGSANTKYLTKTATLFSVSLRPPMTRRVSQLWRLNTANKPIPGDEVLASWHPRGVSLINDYKQIQHRLRLKEKVLLTSQVLTLVNARSQTSQDAITKEKKKGAATRQRRQQAANNNDDDPHADDMDDHARALLAKVIRLWQTKVGTPKEIHLSQDPPIPGMQDLHEPPSSIGKGIKLLAEVKQVVSHQQDSANASRRGYLAYQEDPLDDRWTKRWCVLQRPYLYMYQHQNEQDELGVIHLTSARVDHNQALEALLKRHHVFSLYTSNNAYTLQASSKSDMMEWIQQMNAC